MINTNNSKLFVFASKVLIYYVAKHHNRSMVIIAAFIWENQQLAAVY